MMEPNRIKTDIMPKTIEDLGNGNWYYNYDIKTSQGEDEEGNPVTMYDYIQIKTNSKPNYKTCVEKLIRLYLSQSQEFDLINSYSSYMQNITEDEKAVQEYKDYLNLLSEIKQKVKEDFSKI